MNSDLTKGLELIEKLTKIVNDRKASKRGLNKNDHKFWNSIFHAWGNNEYGYVAYLYTVLKEGQDNKEISKVITSSQIKQISQMVEELSTYYQEDPRVLDSEVLTKYRDKDGKQMTRRSVAWGAMLAFTEVITYINSLNKPEDIKHQHHTNLFEGI